MMAKTRHRNVHSPAAGIPATANPNPARRAWIIETPMIPLTTLRMVCTVMPTISSPWSPATRTTRRLDIMPPLFAEAMRIPAMMIEMANMKRPAATPRKVLQQPFGKSDDLGLELHQRGFEI